jgi:hypothetical protein
VSRSEPDISAYTVAAGSGGVAAIILGVAGLGLTFGEAGFLLFVGGTAGIVARGLFMRIENLEDEVREAQSPRKPKRRR